MIDLKTARLRQKELQQEAKLLLERYGLLDKLAVFGDVVTVGSYQCDLMAVPDIDIEIYGTTLTPSQIYDRCKDIFLAMHRVSIVDRTVLPPKEGRPRGVYIGPQVDFAGNRWKIDIWVMKSHEDKQHNTLPYFKDPDWFRKTSQTERDAMLLLKYQLLEMGKYSAEVKSFQVYQAVLEGVRTLEELKTWIRNAYQIEL